MKTINEQCIFYFFYFKRNYLTKLIRFIYSIKCMAPISLKQSLCQLIVILWVFRQSIYSTYTCEEWNRRLHSSAFTLTSQSTFTAYTRPVIRVKYFDHFQIFLWKILGQSQRHQRRFQRNPGAEWVKATFALSDQSNPGHTAMQDCSTYFVILHCHILSQLLHIFRHPSMSYFSSLLHQPTN